VRVQFISSTVQVFTPSRPLSPKPLHLKPKTTTPDNNPKPKTAHMHTSWPLLRYRIALLLTTSAYVCVCLSVTV
jgi:hypothetical protein